MTRTGVEVRRGESDLDDAFGVRRAVFVDEQGVSEDREIDGRDDEAVHAVARYRGEPVGTARLRALDAKTGKVERVAVVERHRGDGWGRALMAVLHVVARERELDILTLHGQTRVEAFYQALGYETTSDVFEEAGIPHVEMERRLD